MYIPYLATSVKFSWIFLFCTAFDLVSHTLLLHNLPDAQNVQTKAVLDITSYQNKYECYIM
jgi:hypothetical protein